MGIAPNTFQESIAYPVVRQIFEGLMKYQVAADGTTNAVPDLCTGYTVSPDAKVFTFTIRKGVYFQPPVNTEVTAKDFVASWNAAANPKNWIPGTPGYILSPIVGTDDTGAAKAGLTGVKAIGDWTFQVTLKYPFAEFPVSLGHPIASVWPVAYAMKEGIKNFDQKPIGTGPYILETWKHNQEIDLAKNPHWWAASATNGPFVDNIHMPIFQDPSTEWLAFQAGNIDYTTVPVGQVGSSEKLAAQKGWEAKLWPQLGFRLHRRELEEPGRRWRQEPAVAPGPLVLDSTARGLSTRSWRARHSCPTGWCPWASPAAISPPLPYPYDTAKAKQIVQSLGTVPTISMMLQHRCGLGEGTASCPGGLEGRRHQRHFDRLGLGDVPHEGRVSFGGRALPSGVAG